MSMKLNDIAEQLNERKQLQSLMPKLIWSRKLEAEIGALDWNGHASETAVIALMAGLHLRNDSLDTSHSYAQQIEFDSTGAYWHGIMHRMEGDFSNSKYWFRQAGNHPAMNASASRIAEWLKSNADLAELPGGHIRDALLSFRDNAGWKPSLFVDLIQWQEREASHEQFRPILEQLQSIEMDELFGHTYKAALSYM